MIKGGIVAAIFFVLGIILSPYVPVLAEQRSALSDVAVSSASRVPFEAISVYQNEVRVAASGLRYAKVTSDSMAPVITRNSVVFEMPVSSPEEIQLGDIISFSVPDVDSPVLHEVVGIVEQDGEIYYHTKGTANKQIDPWLVSFSDVHGVMVGTFR